MTLKTLVELILVLKPMMNLDLILGSLSPCSGIVNFRFPTLIDGQIDFFFSPLALKFIPPVSPVLAFFVLYKQRSDFDCHCSISRQTFISGLNCCYWNIIFPLEYNLTFQVSVSSISSAISINIFDFSSSSDRKILIETSIKNKFAQKSPNFPLCTIQLEQTAREEFEVIDVVTAFIDNCFGVF